MANPVTHLEKTIAGEVQPVTHLEKVIAEYGGGGGGSFEPTDEQLAAMNSGITAEGVEQIDTNKTNISKIQETYINSMYAGNQVITYTFTLSKDDFNNRSIGMYMIYICNWSYAPSISIYMAAYSGGLTTQSTLQKIAGADANISISDGVITYTGQGYISISAIK
jgi:hypothetical protein